MGIGPRGTFWGAPGARLWPGRLLDREVLKYTALVRGPQYDPAARLPASPPGAVLVVLAPPTPEMQEDMLSSLYDEAALRSKLWLRCDVRVRG